MHDQPLRSGQLRRLACHTQLTELQLHRCGLEELPPAFSKLSSLQHVHIHDDGLAAGVQHLCSGKLRTLLLFCSSLGAMPSAAAQLAQLQHLDLWCSSMPPEGLAPLSCLTALTCLNIRGCLLPHVCTFQAG